MTAPLAGIKVVEISVAMAGPFCGMLLGDYGADVVKIERTVTGDDSRVWAPYFHDSMSYYYAAANALSSSSSSCRHRAPLQEEELKEITYILEWRV